MHRRDRCLVASRLFALLLLPAILLCACYQPKETDVGRRPIEVVLKEQTDHLMSIPGVVGTAVGECEEAPCIKILVEKKTPEIERRVPEALDGWKVEIEEVGKVRAL